MWTQHDYRLCLIGFMPNLALHLGRSASSHSYGYVFSAEHPTCFALFALNPDPFMNYPG